MFSAKGNEKRKGSIAQLGEHLPYKQRVIGSSPIVPTKKSLAVMQAIFVLFVILYSFFFIL